MAEMETQMKELGQQIVTQTYQALSTDESPLATKTDHIRLQNDMNVITQQLSQLLQMVSQGMSSEGFTPSYNATSPARTGKRSKKNRTPEKAIYFEDMLTDDKTVTSATSDLDEGSEGCEE